MAPDKFVSRKGAQKGDLICVSGWLGGAFFGLTLLEREKKIYLEHPKVQPDLDSQAYLVGKLLKPEAQKDIIDFLAEADIVVEAAPAAVFERVAIPAIDAGRIFIPASAGALLPRMHLVRRALKTGARIIVPTGALLGLDAVRAAAEGPVESITIETRKPPGGLMGAPWLEKNNIDLSDLIAPLLVFQGNAFDAAAGFPANVNVAAALALAGIGPVRTKVEIWADPSLTRNVHIIRVEADAARFTMTIENVPSEDNPKTGKLTALSMLACLRGLVSPLRVGS